MSGRTPTAAVEPVTRRPRFEVVRGFDQFKPGQVIEAGSDWPFNRARQLQHLRYLRPLDQEPDAPRRNG